MIEKQWFSSWFDTPYYYILYKNRSEKEAKTFIKALTNYLQLPNTSKVLDLACGKGRHSMTLYELGYDVIGADLSVNSILEAKKLETDRLKFLVHDMREVIPNQSFDAVFNLFTSFGYFDSTLDYEKVLRSIHYMLHSNGLLVIDFLNASKVIDELVESETKNIDGIEFAIRRSFDGTHIFKFIDFDTNGEHFSFMERVQGLDISDFRRLFSRTGFELICTFGDFDLNPFEAQKSSRLIMIAQKI